MKRREGALSWENVNFFMLARSAERKCESVTRFEIERSMRAMLSREVERADVAKRWRPLSLMPGSFSRRRDFRFGGSAFKVMFVKEEAERPDVDRWQREGSCRKVPMMARKFNEIEV